MAFLGFGNSYNKPGPGINKDAPQKTGIALFFDILGREFWQLLTVHFAYLLACLPIITIGPATVALSRVTVTMVRDQNVYAWRDFWDAFRKNIKQGMLFGIPATIFVVTAIAVDYDLLSATLTGNATIASTAFLLMWTLLGVGLGCYIFPMVAYINLPSMPLLKNSMLLLVLGKWRTLAAAFVSIGATAAAVLLFPFSPLFVLFAGYFGFLSFFTSFMVWPVIDKFVVHGAELQAKTDEGETETETETV